MKKVYKFFLLIITLILLSTYSPNQFVKDTKNDSSFFKLKNIIIKNNLLINKDDVKKNLKKIYDRNIFLIKRKDIEESLQNVNFLEKIEVKKKYPDTIVINIFETKPVGIIFKNKSKYLLDDSSNLIEIDDKENFYELPHIKGKGAEKNFVNFLEHLGNNNFKTENIKNYQYFKIGRWDLELLDDTIIKFPKNLTNKIIIKTIKLLDRKDFENYKVIDLRIDGKIIVE